MRFVMYTEKTVAQCAAAIRERLEVKETASRPAMQGWVNKSGEFSISVTSNVIWNFSRRTNLSGKAERESGITVIRGLVADGVGREGQLVIFVALVLVGFILMARGNALLAILAVGAGAVLYIPLVGDRQNSEVLMKELRTILKAKDRPPKKTTPDKASGAPKTRLASLPPKGPATRKAPPPKKPLT